MAPPFIPAAQAKHLGVILNLVFLQLIYSRPLQKSPSDLPASAALSSIHSPAQVHTHKTWILPVRQRNPFKTKQVEPSPPFSSGLPLIPSIFLVLDWKAFSVAQKPFMMWRYLAASPNSSSLFVSSSAIAPVAPSLLLLQLTKHTPASGTRCRTASA